MINKEKESKFVVLLKPTFENQTIQISLCSTKVNADFENRTISDSRMKEVKYKFPNVLVRQLVFLEQFSKDNYNLWKR